MSATDATGAVRAVELPGKRFFLGTLFIPQFSSAEKAPHPVVTAFLHAAASHG
jgi:CTP synthase (UTP-ammonia lyase)